MMKNKFPFTFQNFFACNGLLRFILLVLAVITVGLGAGDYDDRNAGDVYFLIVICFILVLVVFGLLLSLFDVSNVNLQKIKIIDFTLHLSACWLLFNSSIAKLICRSRYESNREAVQIAAGVFGLLTSPLYGWLSHLTNAGKQSFSICRFSPNEVNEMPDDPKRSIKARPILVKSDKVSLADWDWNWKSDLKFPSMASRLQWNVIFDGRNKEKQYRLFSLILGFFTLILAGVSYRNVLRNEDYFMSVVCITFSITLLFHISYILGMSHVEIVEKEFWIFDKSFHLSHGIFLFVGGNLFLTSNMTYNDGLSSQRTLASILGIINGILYFYIGLAVEGKDERKSSRSLIQRATDSAENIHNMNLRNLEDQMTGGKEKITKENNKFSRQIKPSLIFDPTAKV